MGRTKKINEEVINEETTYYEVDENEVLEDGYLEDSAIDENEEIYMPNQETINEWKKEFKNRVYSIKLTDKDIFIWRPLTRKEFKELNQLEADALTKEESLCEICILWPENYGADEIENGIAGAPTILAEHIMQTSGFNDSFMPIEL